MSETERFFIPILLRMASNCLKSSENPPDTSFVSESVSIVHLKESSNFNLNTS